MILFAAARAAPPPVANGAETAGWAEVGAFYAFADASGGVEVCSGTLVAPRVVATAAHCVEKLEQYAAGGFRVYYLEGPSVEDFTSVTEVEQPVAHPDWNERTVSWDIALVSLVDALATVPAALGTAAMDDTWAGREVRLVGWGNVDLEENGSGVKREGTSVVLGVEEDQFQTTVSAGGAATCPGDSGGAVFDESGASPVLVGVVSWGTVDVSADHPCGSVQGHARVDAAQGWLAEQIAVFERDDTGGAADSADTAAAADSGEGGGPGSSEPREGEAGTNACGCAAARGSQGTGVLALGLLVRRCRSPGARRATISPWCS